MSLQDSLRAAAISAPTPPPWPTKIGKFEVRCLLGSGAFGRVYHAFDPELRRDVAIKVPRPEALTPDLAERFIREARAAATIRHANVCPVYDVGNDASGIPYIVMGYVPGKTLSEVIRSRGSPFPPRQAAGVVRRLAQALDAAHQKGVVHRDLKPGNVLVDSDRHDVLITDFGLAKLIGDADAATTKVGDVLGTPAYMAPEQACGEIDLVGPQSDIYSLGVILYEMLTGVLPFRGTATEVIYQVLAQEPKSISTLRPELDGRLDAICRRAMAKASTDRFHSAREMANVLGDYLRTSDQKAPAETTAIAGVELDLIAIELPAPTSEATPPSRPGIGVSAERPASIARPQPAPVQEPQPEPEEVVTAVLARKTGGRKVHPRKGLRRRKNEPNWMLWSVVAVVGFALVVYGSVRAIRPSPKVDPAPAENSTVRTPVLKPTVSATAPPMKLEPPLQPTRPSTTEIEDSQALPTKELVGETPKEAAPKPHTPGEPAPMPEKPVDVKPTEPVRGMPYPKGPDGKDPIIGPDGRPIPLGPDGMPALRGPNGEWIPVGPDGKPLPRNMDGKGPKYGPKYGPDGRPLPPPGKGFPPRNGNGPMGPPPM